jgi:hypothetical protein
MTLASHGGEAIVDCIDVLGQLADFLDDDAREELCRDIKAHMARCRDCTVEVDTIKKTIVLYQAESGRSIEVPMRVTQRLEEALAKEYETNGRGESG